MTAALIETLFSLAVCLLFISLLMPATISRRLLPALCWTLAGLARSGWWLLGKWLALLKLPFLLIGWIAGRKGPPTPSKPSARFLGWWKQRKVISRLLRDGGLRIDGRRKIKLEDAYGHIFVAAPSRAGKSAVVVKPMLMDLPLCSGLVTDPGGELFDECAGWLQKRGWRTVRLNPLEMLSDGFNPLLRTDTAPRIRKLTELLEPKNLKEAPIWGNGVRELLRILISGLRLEGNPEFINLLNLRNLVISCRKPMVVYKWLANLGNDQLARDFLGLANAEDKSFSGIVSGVNAALSPFSDADWSAFLTHDSCGDFQACREEPTLYFLSFPEHYRSIFDKITSIFMTQLLDSLLENGSIHDRKQLPFVAVLDEFGELSKSLHPDFPGLIATCGRRKIALVMIAQDHAQLRQAFSGGESTVLSNASTKLFISGQNNPETIRLISEALGKGTMKIDGKEATTDLMSPEAIRNMPPFTGILFPRFSPPIYTKLVPYFQNPSLMPRANLPFEYPKPLPTTPPELLDLFTDDTLPSAIALEATT